MKIEFKPQLFPNEQVNPSDMVLPLIGSYKLDGIRMTVKDGQLLSRSLKPIPNKWIQQQYDELKTVSKRDNVVFDGELYSHHLNFQEITHFVMSHNDTPPDHLEFWGFDIFVPARPLLKFSDRLELLNSYIRTTNEIQPVLNRLVQSAQEITELYNQAIADNYEGLILLNPDSIYKFGRHTIKSGNAYKLKGYREFDGIILDMDQATIVDPGVERTLNELGRHVTSRKKDDRILIHQAGSFVSRYANNPIKVMLPFTNLEKEQFWKNKSLFIGKHFSYKGMMEGAKDVPRHPVFTRFRPDLDE